MTNPRIKASKETIARSLHGNWRREHVHALTQELAAYDFLEQQITECDEAIKTALEQLPVLESKPQPSIKALRSPHRSGLNKPHYTKHYGKFWEWT